jgi:hypothetical protein
MASPAPASVKSGIAITDLLIGIAPHRPSLPRLSTGTSAERANTSISPLLDCVVTINSYQAINYFLSGKVPQRMGNAHSNMVPYQVFRCKEGDVIVAVGNDTQYAAFCGVIGRPDLAEDARFTTAAQRNRKSGDADSPDCRGDAGQNHDGMGDADGSGERALRPDLQHEAGVRRPAGQASGHAARSGTQQRFESPIACESDSLLRYADSLPTLRANLGEHTDRVLQDMLAFQPRPSTP